MQHQFLSARAGRTASAAILGVLAITVAGDSAAGLAAQQRDYGQASNDLPQLYQRDATWAKLPDGVALGSVIGIEAGPDGNIYVFHRPAPPQATILVFEPSGKLLRSFGMGILNPHGFHIDREGNIWASDGAYGRNRQDAMAGRRVYGNQVFKFSPEGKVLMRLGQPGVSGGGNDALDEPTDVVTAPNGDIFVTEGHTTGDGNHRVVKFSKDGKFIKAWGGKRGSARGEFSDPHSIAMDSQGRLFVADRWNRRIQIFDQDGRYLDEWTQFGQPSGLYITKDDTLYVADSSSWGKGAPGSGPDNPGVKKGVRYGSAKDGKVVGFIEDIESMKTHSTMGQNDHSGPESVGVDASGNVYFGVVYLREADPKSLRLEKHSKKK